MTADTLSQQNSSAANAAGDSPVITVLYAEKGHYTLILLQLPANSQWTCKDPAKERQTLFIEVRRLEFY